VNITIKHVELAMALTEELHLSVAEVMEIVDCDKDYANRLMHDLVLMNLASWNLTTGAIDYEIFWRKRGV